MILLDATRAALRQTFRFRGRASRREYWGFLATILLVIAVIMALGATLFEPREQIIYGYFEDEDGTVQPQLMKARSFPFWSAIGIVMALFALPVLSATWRRLHDAGRPGWHLLAPWGLFVFAVFASMVWTVEPPVLTADMAELGPDARPLPYVPEPIRALVRTVWWCALVITTYWLLRPPEPGANKYGPNPTEVTS